MMGNLNLRNFFFCIILLTAGCNSGGDAEPASADSTMVVMPDSITYKPPAAELYSDSIFLKGIPDSGLFLIASNDSALFDDFGTQIDLAKIPFLRIGNKRVFQGDIILNDESKIPFTKMETMNSQVHYFQMIEESDRPVTKTQQNKFFAVSEKLFNKRWTDNTMYYTIDPNLISSKENILTAINLWAVPLQGVFKFVQIDPDQNQGIGNYIEFKLDGGYSSLIGMAGSRVQQITLPGNASTGNIVHEIGHALGLWHEHSHPNRNHYIDIFLNNIKPTGNPETDKSIASQFELLQPGFADTTDYDFNSVMHYPYNAFAQERKVTIAVKKQFEKFFYTIGKRESPSALDIQQIIKIYSK